MTEKCPRKSVFICGNLFLIIEKTPRAFEIINPIKRSKISPLLKNWRTESNKRSQPPFSRSELLFVLVF